MAQKIERQIKSILKYPMPDINFSPQIPPLKKIKDKTKIDVRYCLIAPYAYAHIYWDPKEYELFYEIEEPELTAEEKKLKDQIIEALKSLVDFDMIIDKDLSSLLEYIHQRARILAFELEMEISYESYNKIYYYLCRDFVGMNETEPILRDFFVEDIECNGVDTPIYVVHRYYRNIKTNVEFENLAKAENFTEKLAQRCGKHISYSQPILDGSLQDGSRVNATYTKDITSRGPTFTIRKFTQTPWTPPQLISFKTLSLEMMAYLWMLVEHKMNILIAGGTGSGKTTLLNVLAFFIPPEARVVSIEDSVTGDSKIIIREKEKVRNITIKDFVDKKIDAEVMTLDEKGKIIFIKPSDYIKHKVSKEIYEVITSTGRKVKVTQDHSLFSLGENGLAEIKPTELQENKSFIAVPRVLPIEGNEVKEINLTDYLEFFKEDFICGEPIKILLDKYDYHILNVEKERYRWWKNNKLMKVEEFMKLNAILSYNELLKLKIKSKNKSSIPVIFPINNEFLQFCGLWLGDGSYDNYNKNSVILSNVDEECRKILRDMSGFIGSNYSAMSGGGVSLRIHNSVFYKFMKNVLKLDGYSNSKKIPEFIFSLSNEQVKHFIKGYFSADGCVKKFEVSCASQSYELLEDLQSLFLRFGIISRINDFERKDKCINMSISGFDNISKFKSIGFLQERKNSKLNLMNKKSHHASSDIIPLSVGQLKELNSTSSIKLSWPYLQGMQNIGRDYMQKISPTNSKFNDLSHTDILWDKIKKIRKLISEEVEVFDLSIPKHEKFLCNNIFVHNTRELNLPRENWLPSVARSALNVGGAGEVDLFSLLKNSFRQSPDYVIVGEVRGKEAFVLFQGMASGHSSLSTFHADSVDTLIRRLETPPIELSPTLVNTLDVVAIATHATVNKQETRKVREIVEIVNVEANGAALTNTPFMWNARDNRFYFKKDSRVFDKITMKYGLAKEELLKEFERRAKLLYAMASQNVTDYNEVQAVIHEYTKNPDKILKRFNLA